MCASGRIGMVIGTCIESRVAPGGRRVDGPATNLGSPPVLAYPHRPMCPYDPPMTDGSSRINWLIFLALGFMWGSSYLFIKLAVDDFGTFTLIGLRLLVGAAFLWIVVRASRTPLPRVGRIYGHLIVMSVINIVLPFSLITWAEQSVDSALAAILNSTVPLMVIVIAPLFLPEEPIRINGVSGLMIGFLGIFVIVSPGLAGAGGTANIAGELAMLASSLTYAIGNVYNRRNVRGLPPLIPAVFQVTFALVIVGILALVVERPWEAAPAQPDGWFSVIWLGIFGSGLAYLGYFRLLGRWGATRTSLVAYLLPIVGIVLGFAVLQEPIDISLIAGHSARDRRGGAGQWAMGPPPPLRLDAARGAPLARLPGGLAVQRPAIASSRAPPTISPDAPTRRTVSPRLAASPIRTDPQAAANTVADSRSGATPDNGATLRATRMHR